MKRYELTPALRYGNELIDSEHQKIFDEVNKLMEFCQSGHAREHLKEVAEFLVDYVDVHFSDEEGLQTQYEYPDYPAHHKFHEWYNKGLREKMIAARSEKNLFNILTSINKVTDILVKHIQTEDSRVAKWVRDRENKGSFSRPAARVSKPVSFTSAFKEMSGKKEIGLRSAVDLTELQKLQELFTAATGLSCAVVDASGNYVTKGSGSNAFNVRYAQGKHEELAEFTQDLIIDGYRAGSVIGGAVRNGQENEPSQDAVAAAGQLFAEMLNLWANAAFKNSTDTGNMAAFGEESKRVQEAVSQIKNRAKGLEQTATMEKMLSLNAAIEAGRAGKAGVGFAVVAEEIGRMANESAVVYREIQELVRKVEESMNRLEQMDIK